MYGRWIKRPTDVVCATVLFVLLSPVILLISFLIFFSFSGPVLFRQSRVGREGRSFLIYKFRTLPHVERDESIPTDEGAKDITKFGRFLRRRKLDELPQLFNVIVGDLSLIGPRPYVPSMVAALEHNFGQLAQYRKSVTPGLTGLTQVRGNRHLYMIQRLQLDADYIRNLSLKNDISILWNTISIVLSGGSVNEETAQNDGSIRIFADDMNYSSIGTNSKPSSSPELNSRVDKRKKVRRAVS